MDAVKVHYERDELVEGIKKALEQGGLGTGELTLEEVAPIDHFHVRGIDATKDLAEILQATSSSKILDIGSGLGGPARYFAKMFGAKVTGIDLTQSYVDAAQYLTMRTGLSAQVKFDCGDALALPYADNSFDIAMTQHVAMNVPGDEGDVYFPVPWADSPATSFLLSEDALKKVLLEQHFKIIICTDRTVKAIEWVTAISQKQAQSSNSLPLLGLNIVAGPDFSSRAANLAKSLRDGRARILEVVATK